MKNYYKFRSRHPAEAISFRIEGAYHRFFAGFADSAGIEHSLSKGEAREGTVKEFFESLLPSRFAVSSGEVIDTKRSVSAQSDLLIYRSEDGIPILSGEPTILPVEAVMSVIEIKSRITVAEYRDCVKKARKFCALAPFGKSFEDSSRGRQPAPEDCRVFISVFAYSTDIGGNLREEYERYARVVADVGAELGIIDRIYILGKGIVNPTDGKYVSFP